MIVPFDSVIRHGPHLIAFDRKVCSQAHLEAIGKRSYERCEVAAVQSVIRPGDRVLEGGSGIGIIATALAAIVGGDNLVCCEANPLSARLARRTLALNGHHSNFYEGILDAQPPEAASQRPFLVARDFLASSAVKVDDLRSTVPVSSLHFDSLLDRHRIDTLVLDIEGGECALLGSSPLNTIRKVIVEVHPKLVGSDATITMVRRLEATGLQLRWDLIDESVFIFERCASDQLNSAQSSGQSGLLEVRLEGVTSPRAGDEHLRCVSELVRQRPENRNFRNEMAFVLMSRRDWNSALSVLSETPHDDDPFAFHLEAQCHLGLGRVEAADACWTQAKLLAPDRSLTHAMLAHCALRRGRSEQALRSIQDAVGLCPYVSWYWTAFARVAEARNRPSLADAARATLSTISAEQSQPAAAA